MADSQRKTANLFSIDMAHDDYSTLVYHYTISGLTPNNQYTCSSNFVQSGSSASIWFGGTSTGTNGVSDGNPKTMTSNANGEIDFYINHNTGNAYSQVVNGTAWIMVNEGSTPLPYEPYWQHSLRKLGTSTDTITTLPADVYADGNNASVGLVGNMEQSGTPSPTTPIQPSECGERTGNLFDKDNPRIYNGYYKASTNKLTPYPANAYIYIPVEPNKTYFIYNIKRYDSASTTRWVTTENTFTDNSDVIRTDVIQPNTAVTAITTGANERFLGLFMCADVDYQGYGSVSAAITANCANLTIDNGYKIPISSANTTTPVYLGEVQTTRKIKKYEFTGNETFYASSQTSVYYSTVFVADANKTVLYKTGCICNSYKIRKQSTAANLQDGEFTTDTNGYIWFRNYDYETLTDFKTYLQQQYAAGTPVCVWYVLATPTTGIVNEPLRKIGDYADTVSGITIPTITGADSFDVLTTLKPSEVELTYTGWHDASVKEWDGSEWQ